MLLFEVAAGEPPGAASELFYRVTRPTDGRRWPWWKTAWSASTTRRRKVAPAATSFEGLRLFRNGLGMIRRSLAHHQPAERPGQGSGPAAQPPRARPGRSDHHRGTPGHRAGPGRRLPPEDPLLLPGPASPPGISTCWPPTGPGRAWRSSRSPNRSWTRSPTANRPRVLLVVAPQVTRDLNSLDLPGPSAPAGGPGSRGKARQPGRGPAHRRRRRRRRRDHLWTAAPTCSTPTCCGPAGGVLFGSHRCGRHRRGAGLPPVTEHRLVATSPAADHRWDGRPDRSGGPGPGHRARGPVRRLALPADLTVGIPMLGSGDSLNVSASAAVLLYEAVRQRSLPES